MNRYDIAQRVGVISIILLIVEGMILSNISENSAIELESSYIFQLLNSVVSLLMLCPGLYLWITGFKRFKYILGNYGFKWLAYFSFSIIGGFYMQYKYGGHHENS